MKKFIIMSFLAALAGCTSTIDKASLEKIDKAAKLADQIEMNGYKLVATNKTLILIAPKQ